MDTELHPHEPWMVTLVLVTIGIGAVFLPIHYILHRGPQPGQKPSCTNNMKRLATALSIYCSDYDRCLPSSAGLNGSHMWNKSDFIKFATTKYAAPADRAKRQSYGQMIGDYVRDEAVFTCLSDPASNKTKASYYWKLAIDKAWYGEGCSKPYRKIDDYPYATDTILLYERQGFHDENKPLANGTKINVVYLDSHVKHITLTNATSGDPANPAANADGAPMYFNYDYKTDKGLTSETTPAKWTDPSRYGDKY